MRDYELDYRHGNRYGVGNASTENILLFDMQDLWSLIDHENVLKIKNGFDLIKDLKKTQKILNLLGETFTNATIKQFKSVSKAGKFYVVVSGNYKYRPSILKKFIQPIMKRGMWSPKTISLTYLNKAAISVSKKLTSKLFIVGIVLCCAEILLDDVLTELERNKKLFTSVTSKILATVLTAASLKIMASYFIGTVATGLAAGSAITFMAAAAVPIIVAVVLTIGYEYILSYTIRSILDSISQDNLFSLHGDRAKRELDHYLGSTEGCIEFFRKLSLDY